MFTLAVILALVLFISRRRSNVAKWILLVVWVLGLPAFIGVLRSGLFSSQWVMLLQTIVQIAAIALLFTPSARAWLAADKATA